ATSHRAATHKIECAIGALQHDLHASQQALRTSEQARDLARIDSDALSRDLAHARAALCELGRVQRDYELSTSMLGKKSTELRKTKDALDTARKDFEIVKAERNTLKHDLRSARADLSTSRADLATAQAALATSHAELNEATRELDVVRAARDKAREDASRRRAAYHDLREMNQDVVAAYNASRSQCARAQRRHAALERYTDELKAMAKGVLEDYGRVNEEKRGMVDQIARMAEELRSVEGETASAKEEAAKARAEKERMARENVGLREDADALRGHAKAAHERARVLEEALRERDQDVHELTADVEKLDGVVVRLRQAATVVLEENDALAAEVRLLKAAARSPSLAAPASPTRVPTDLNIAGSATDCSTAHIMACSTTSSSTLNLSSLQKDRTMLMRTDDSFDRAALGSSVISFAASIGPTVAHASSVLTKSPPHQTVAGTGFDSCDADTVESDMSLCDFDCSPSSWTMLSSLPSVSIPGTPPSHESYWSDDVKIFSAADHTQEDWSTYLAPKSCPHVADQLKKACTDVACPQIPQFRPMLFTCSPVPLDSVSMRVGTINYERPIAGRRRAVSSSATSAPVSLPLWPRLFEGDLAADGYRHVLEKRAAKRWRHD
ncbi:hypothetical protein HDZ31DRAFT_50152, partial [Schizophyllum fasciatum]